jgi:hypothetical protein
MKSIIHRLMPVRQKLVATGAGIRQHREAPVWLHGRLQWLTRSMSWSICHGLSPHAAAYLRSTVRM